MSYAFFLIKQMKGHNDNRIYDQWLSEFRTVQCEDETTQKKFVDEIVAKFFDDKTEAPFPEAFVKHQLRRGGRTDRARRRQPYSNSASERAAETPTPRLHEFMSRVPQNGLTKIASGIRKRTYVAPPYGMDTIDENS